MQKALPPLDASKSSIEDQARRVLCVLSAAAEPGNRSTSNPANCPNCDAPVDRPTSPYCTDACQTQAAFVRQFRAGLATGALLLPEKQLAFGERLWWILGGGLPLRENRIPESAKRQVAKRCGGKCESCGAPMTAIENVGSGCNRPLHLRAVCDACSKTKPFADEEFVGRPEVQRLLTDIATRIQAPEPLRPCDDPESWDWRAYVAKRR